MDAYFLVDFDNVCAGRPGGVLAVLGRRLAAAAQAELSGRLGEVRLRLYGGWYAGQGLSNSGTRLTQEIAADFPMVVPRAGGRTRVHCEIASSLLASPGVILDSTYRVRRGMRCKLQRTPGHACAGGQGCSVDAVVAWSRGRCPVAGCREDARSVFTYGEQKLVDTLLCCDLLELANRRPKPAVFVASDDDDLLPAILMASRGGDVWRCRRRAGRTTAYDAALAGHAVRCVDL